MQQNPGNVYKRHSKYTDVKEISGDIVLEYLCEAPDNKSNSIKITEAKDKIVNILDDLKKAFKTINVLSYFESFAYSQSKEYMMWITNAKKEETRLKRIIRATDKLAFKEMVYNDYDK